MRISRVEGDKMILKLLLFFCSLGLSHMLTHPTKKDREEYHSQGHQRDFSFLEEKCGIVIIFTYLLLSEKFLQTFFVFHG